MGKGFILLLTPLFFGLASVEAKDPLSPGSLYDKAQSQYLRGDFKDALTLLDSVIKENPRLLPAYALRARLWHVLGDYTPMRQDARKVLAEFVKVNYTAQDYVAQGSAYLLLGEPDNALSSFGAALKLNRDLPEALSGRARVWRAKNDFKQALEDLDELIAKARPPAPLYFYNRAQAHYDLEQYDKAIFDLTSALRINRKFDLAFSLLGSIFAKKGDLARALQAYSRAIALNAQAGYPRLGRAAVLLAQQEEEAAFKDFNEAVDVNPEDFGAYFNRGLAYWRKGAKEQALADFDKALAAEAPDAASLIVLGDRFALFQYWPQALSAYAKALELSDDAAILLRRAAAHEGMKNFKAALEDLTDAVAKAPSSAPAVAARGLLLMRMGKDAQALADLNRAYRIDPKNIEVLIGRGSFMARTNKPSAALADFNAAIELGPKTSAEAYNNRGALYANAFSDLEKALQDISVAVELKPKDPGYHFNLGVIRLKSRNYLQALSSFDLALSLRGPAARILQYRAETYSQMGDFSKAMRDIQAALEKDPKNAALHDTLGNIRLRLRDYDLALQDLKQALKLDPRNVSALLHRGLAYAGKGSLKNARRDFQSASEEDPRSKEALTFLCAARRMLKDPADAVKDCSRVITESPEYGPAYIQRGLAYLALSDAANAVEDLDKGARLGARRVEGLLAQSVAHAMAKQFKQAHEKYTEAMSLDPDAHSPDVGLVAARRDTDEYHNAVSELEFTEESDISDPYVYLVKGDSRRSAGQYEKAVSEYTKAMELDGSLAEAYAARGAALSDQNALDAAQQDFIRAIELDGKSAGHRVRLAALLTLKGSYRPALEQISQAVALDSKHPESYLRAGNAYYFLGDFKQALANYQAAVKLDALNPAFYNGAGLGFFALGKYPEALENFSRAIALYAQSDRYHRNRGSTYTNMGEYSNAVLDFKNASVLNNDPSLVEEYINLIHQSEARGAEEKPEESG